MQEQQFRALGSALTSAVFNNEHEVLQTILSDQATVEGLINHSTSTQNALANAVENAAFHKHPASLKLLLANGTLRHALLIHPAFTNILTNIFVKSARHEIAENIDLLLEHADIYAHLQEAAEQNEDLTEALAHGERIAANRAPTQRHAPQAVGTTPAPVVEQHKLAS